MTFSPAQFARRYPWLAWILVLAIFGGAVGVGVLGGAWMVICREGRCPSIASLEAYVPSQTSKVYAADGRFITELGLERRTLVSLSQIPKHVRDAVVRELFGRGICQGTIIVGESGRRLEVRTQ